MATQLINEWQVEESQNQEIVPTGVHESHCNHRIIINALTVDRNGIGKGPVSPTQQDDEM